MLRVGIQRILYILHILIHIIPLNNNNKNNNDDNNIHINCKKKRKRRGLIGCVAYFLVHTSNL